MLWRRKKKRSVMVWIAGGSGVVCSLLALFISIWKRNVPGLNPYSGPLELDLIYLIYEELSEFVLPLLIIVTAVFIAVNQARREEYKLVTLTTLSNSRLTQAHLLDVLYRWRVLLAFIIGLVPLQIIMALAPDSWICAGSCYWYWLYWLSGSQLGGLVGTLIMLLGTWLVYGLAATVGVWLGLWWRNRVIAGLAAFGSLLILLLLRTWAENSVFFLNLQFSLLDWIALAALRIGIPTILFLCALFLTNRWVRKPE